VITGLTHSDKISNELTPVKVGGNGSSWHFDSRTNGASMYVGTP